MEIKLSVIIIARNEEQKIGECLKTVSWADEVIVVVDEDTTDKTAQVVKRHKAKIVKGRKGYTPNRNLGLKAAKGEWVLYIDADERVTSELTKEVINITSHPEPAEGSVAYAIPRKNIIFGKEFKHGGLWPDYVKRLFKKDTLKKWKGEVHEEPVFSGKLGHLKSPLIHKKHDNLEEMVEKTNEWSEIEARLMFEAGHPKMNVLRFLSAMLREFWLRMIRQRAFLDGPKGIIYALYQVFSRFVSYAKLWEMQLVR